MSDQTELYIATIFYTDETGRGRNTVQALVAGTTQEEAIAEAYSVVRSAFPDAQLIGGILEPADNETMAALIPALAALVAEQEAQPAQRAYRAPGTTVH